MTLQLGSKLPRPPEDVLATLRALYDEAPSESWFRTWSDALTDLSDTYISALWFRFSNGEDKAAKSNYKDVLAFRGEAEGLIAKLERKGAQFQTDNPRLQRIVEQMRRQQDLNTPEVAALEARERELKDTYDTIGARQTIVQDGVEVPAAQVAKELTSEADRGRREALWQAVENRKSRDFEAVDRMFLELIELRREIGSTVGLSYRDYAWRKKGRYEYTPEQSLRWLEIVQEKSLPLESKFAQHAARQLSVERLRPWDLGVKPSPKNLFDASDYLRLSADAYGALHPSFGETVRRIAERGHADLTARPGKRRRFMSSILVRGNEPVVYCYNVGDLSGLRVTLHEFGHALHYGAYAPEKYMFEIPAPVEIAEFSAYVFQMLAVEQLELSSAITRDEADQLMLVVLEQVLGTFTRLFTYERFQHWVYKEPKGDAGELDDYFISLPRDTLIDWSGLEHFERKRWQYRHLIAEPFYSVEYAISWIAVLLFWEKYKRDPSTLELFYQTLQFGKTRTAGETLQFLGINFPFSDKDVKTAVETLEAHFTYLIE